MGAEELGSVYESLLELVPQVRIGESDPFRFVGDQASGEGSEGNTRKLTGSYYTPDSLVQVVLDSALEPVIAARVEGVATNSEAAAEALLSITCMDPAMGSGHFLLGAARRLASHLARLRTDGTPSAAQYRAALRDVITHCIFGIDKNALAVELARMALWLEAATPETPLGFIDHHLRHGDALLGLIDPGVLHHGIPDEAYDALAADERSTTSMLKRRNRQERVSLEAQRRDGPQMGLLPTESLGSDEYTALEKMPDDTPERLAAKRTQSEALAARVADSGVMLAANLYVAAFLLPKRGNGDDVPTTRDVVAALQGQKVPDQVRSAAEAVAHRERFTHWKLAFPQVFACGGFDVVVGNPPWEKVKLSEKEYFATRAPDIANARNASERKRAIERLADAPDGSVEARLFEDYLQALRSAEGTGAWLHTSDRFELTGRGDVNLYAVFAETMMRISDDRGRSGIIVPTGIATDDSTKAFFGAISSQGRLVSLYDFENREGIFPAVDSRMKFCLLTLGSAGAAEFIFFATNARQLGDERRRFRLSPDEFALINPNSLTCPVLRSDADA
nr:N-6 DNA methylase [Burkholderiales bacterium]